VFVVAFLGLRTAAGRLFPRQPDFPLLADRLAGGVAGLATAYLAVGLVAILVQMLPVAPDFLGYEAFRYVPAGGEPGVDIDQVKPGDRLWLDWDRGTLAVFAYLSGGPLGSDADLLLRRYGDVYPAEETRTAKYGGEVDLDDFFYYFWYRRWLAIYWRTDGRVALGPIPEQVQWSGEGRGLILENGRARIMDDLDMRILEAAREPALEDFPSERAPSGDDFLLVRFRFKAVNRWPQTVDSAQFTLIDTYGAKLGGVPRVYGRARVVQGHDEMLSVATAPEAAPRDLRFHIPAGREQGTWLADGMAWEFTESRQFDVTTLVFALPKGMRTSAVRLMYEASGKPPAAPSEAGKAAPAAAPRKASP